MLKFNIEGSFGVPVEIARQAVQKADKELEAAAECAENNNLNGAVSAISFALGELGAATDILRGLSKLSMRINGGVDLPQPEDFQKKASEKVIDAISVQRLGIKDLQTLGCDSKDHHDCAVWAIKAALTDAYNAGRANQSK